MEAEVRQLIGLAYFGMSRFDEAEDQLSQTVSLRQSALGEYSDEARETMDHLQFLLAAAGRPRKREDVQHDIWKLQEHNYGADHESTLVARTDWIGSLQLSEVSKAVTLAGETVQMWKNRYGDDHKKTVGAERSLAWHLLKAGRLNESEELARHSYERMKRLYSSDEGLVQAGRRTLAASLVMLGRRDEAKELYEHRSLPKDMQIKQVLQGSFDPTAGGTQVIVFWEAWCPFCPRAFPILEEVYRDYSDLGLNVVGMTRADGDSTGEMARIFLRDKNVSYANVHVNNYFEFFDFGGIPHMWLMHDQELVWEGNPLSTRGLWEKLTQGLGLQDSSKAWSTKGRADADG